MKSKKLSEDDTIDMSNSKFEKADKDLVRRKIRFEDEVQIETQPRVFSTTSFGTIDMRLSSEDLVDDEEFGDTKDFKLRKLFKKRARKLIERAESLTTPSFETILSQYNFKQEEEKEFMATGKIDTPDFPKDTKKIVTIPASAPPKNINIEIGITPRDQQASNARDKEKEDKKGDVKDEETKGNIESAHLSGTKRKRCDEKEAHDKSHFGKSQDSLTAPIDLSSLKEFTCSICMDYMVGTKKLQCGHCFCDQ